jgi:hypothetical protein
MNDFAYAVALDAQERILVAGYGDQGGTGLDFAVARLIGVPNQPPAADGGGPYTPDEGSAITFSAAGSADPDGDTLQYRWDFDSATGRFNALTTARETLC